MRKPWVCRLRLRWRESANCVKNLPPVANRRNPNLLQVLGRQAAQDVEVDPVVAKYLLVRLQAEAAQPLPDVQFASAPAPLAFFERRPARFVRYALGCTFWFSRNRLPGSYLVF